MTAQTDARDALEVLLSRTTPRETTFTRKRRTVERKPAGGGLDDMVLETYNNETAYEIEVPTRLVSNTLAMLRKSTRYLEDETGHEMRLKTQTAPGRANKTRVKFMAHPPLERGRRVSNK